MIMDFVRQSRSVHTVTIHFFETNHGQSEGDSMHSCIERAMRQAGDLFLPSQLVSVCKMARNKPRAWYPQGPLL